MDDHKRSERYGVGLTYHAHLVTMLITPVDDVANKQ
jgi:hypothetical protein